MVRADLEARGLQVFPVSAATHQGLRELSFGWPSWCGRRGPPRRRRRRPGSCCARRAVDDSGFTVVKDGDRYVVTRQQADPLGPPDRLLQRRGRRATWPTGWPGSASRRPWSRPGPQAGDEVVIGEGERGVRLRLGAHPRRRRRAAARAPRPDLRLEGR